ncbi:hypothetical protein ACNF40_02965 [Cuniculiplasma sp. SKW4]|uniref:hypothetical protein n=1 Tax=Cuniculiplasma sp. SKW4 TaxID=3400171 RepID=UPI003FD66B5F
MDRLLLDMIRRGKTTTKEMLRELLKNGGEISMRSIQMRVESLLEKGLISRRRKNGKEYVYSLNGKIIK